MILVPMYGATKFPGSQDLGGPICYKFPGSEDLDRQAELGTILERVARKRAGLGSL